MVKDLAMLMYKVSMQLDQFGSFLNFLQQYGKMSRDIREKMNDTKLQIFKKHWPTLLATS